MIDRIVGQLRPREGWAPMVLLSLTGILLITAITEADWVPGDMVLLQVALIALLTGRWTARTRWSRRTQALYAVDAGLLMVLWLTAGGPDRIADLIQRWWVWMQVAFEGGGARDPSIFLLYASILTWGAAFFAGWWIGQGHNALTGFLPVLTLSSLSAFYAGRLNVALGLGLFTLLILTAVGDIRASLGQWADKGVDCVVDLDFNTVVAATRVALVIVLLGTYLPNVDVERVTRWVRDTFTRPRERAEAQAERLFGGVRPPHRGLEGPEGSGDLAGHLPRVHLLGGSPDLRTTEAFRVWAEDVPSPYWRGMTYDYYTGRGWLITVEEESVVTSTLPITPALTTQPVSQRVRLASERGGTLYALAEPVRLQAAATVLRRGPGDLGGAAVSEPDYKVISLVPQPTPQELRLAPPTYSAAITTLYLQLPETVPERIRDLAREVVSGGDTTYDQAVRLEQYLRGFPYTLDVDIPPADRDVADYFLFDLGEGYCDYYATAYVVMARSVGIPARLAVGYLGGQPDPDDGSRILVEASGHSWPEVYFHQWGWISFEPTGTRPELERLQVGVEDTPVEDLPERPRRPIHLPRWAWAALGFAASAGVVAWAWRRRVHRAEGPLNLIAVWRGLVHSGGHLGIERLPGQTVMEYVEALTEEIQGRADAASFGRRLRSSQASDAQAALSDFAQAYSSYLYGGGPDLVKPCWAALQHNIARFRWVGLLQQWIRLARPSELAG